jgi:hypothetical protein
MNDEVRDYLSKQANERETYKDFIRNSEEYFGIDKRPLFFMTLEDVKEYVDFLDNLWLK